MDPGRERPAHEHLAGPDAPMLATARGVRATWMSLAGLTLTAGAQLVIVMVTGSVALLADSIHNFSDALTAIPMLVAFRLGRRPPNRRFPYGYHRAEDLAGLAIVLVIAASTVLAAVIAVERFLDPAPIRNLGIVIAAGTIGVIGNGAVAEFRIRVGRQIGSAALVADGLHARTDSITSLGVIAGALGTLAGLERADALAALVITVVIAYTLVEAARTVLHRMLDGTDEPTIALIETAASGVPGVEHVTDARARWVGHSLRAELSIDVARGLTVEQGHDISELVRQSLLRTVPRLADAMVHVDPHDHGPHERGGVQEDR